MPTVGRDGDIGVISCSSAAEFLQVLDPIQGLFRHEPTYDLFIFRGVTSARYSLLPVAFRDDTWLVEGNQPITGGQFWVQGPRPTINDQIEAELGTLRRFVEIASRHGVRLPEDARSLRVELDDFEFRYRAAHRYDWPPVQLLSLIALAQHYGVPTRALDWTTNALVAAYFASQAPVATDDTIAVWAFDIWASRLQRQYIDIVDYRPPLHIFTAPGADNDNLRAQRGVFMLAPHTLDVDNVELFKPTPYDITLPTLFPLNDFGQRPFSFWPGVLFKITVPCAESSLVRAILASVGVTAGSLFPGIWGVAREFHEERRLATHEVRTQSSEREQSSQRLWDEVRALFKRGGY